MKAVVIPSHSLVKVFFWQWSTLCLWGPINIGLMLFIKKILDLQVGVFLPVCASQRSALFSPEENAVDTFCWYKLPLAETYQIHQQRTGVLECLGKIILVIVHILVITTFLTFIRWLLHTRKLAEQPCCSSVAGRDSCVFALGKNLPKLKYHCL